MLREVGRQYREKLKPELWRRITWTRFPVLPPISWVTLGKLLKFFCLSFFISKMGIIIVCISLGY